MAVSRGKIKLNNFKGNNDVIELKQLKVTFVKIVANTLFLSTETEKSIFYSFIREKQIRIIYCYFRR